MQSRKRHPPKRHPPKRQRPGGGRWPYLPTLSMAADTGPHPLARAGFCSWEATAPGGRLADIPRGPIHRPPAKGASSLLPGLSILRTRAGILGAQGEHRPGESGLLEGNDLWLKDAPMEQGIDPTEAEWILKLSLPPIYERDLIRWGR